MASRLGVWFDRQPLGIESLLILQFKVALMDRDELEYRACLLQDPSALDRLRWVEDDGRGGVASLLPHS